MNGCYDNERLINFAKYMFRCGEDSYSHRKETSTNKEIEEEVIFALQKFFEEVVLPAKTKKLQEENKLN